MKKIILLTFLLPLIIYSKEVSINEFVKSYIDKTYKIKQDKELLNQAIADVIRTYAIDDIYLYGNGGYTYSKGVSSDSLIPKEKSNIYSFMFGASKTFSDTGTRVKVDTSVSKIDSVAGLSMYSSFIPGLAMMAGQEKTIYMNSLKFSITQPLLKNFFGIIDKSPNQLSTIAKEIREVLNQESFEKELTNAISLYLRWLFLYNQIKMLEDIVKENKDVFRQTEDMVKAGVSNKADLETARVVVIMYEKTLLEVKKSYEAFLEEVKKYCDLNGDDIPLFEFNFNINVQKQDITSIRAIKMVEKYISQVNISLEVAKNKRLPSLDFVTYYTLYGSGDSIGNSYSSLKTSEFFIGLQLSFPLFNFDSRGEIKKLESEYERLMLEKEKTIKDLNAVSDSLLDNIKNLKTIIEKQKEYILSLETKLRYQREQYRQGILSLAEVTRTSSDLANAKLALIGYNVDFYTNYYNYLELTDSIESVFKY